MANTFVDNQLTFRSRRRQRGPTGPDPGDAGPARPVKSVNHAIDVLEAVARSGRPLGVSELSRHTGLSKATVHHLLATLANRGLVLQEEDTRAYSLGWGLYELGAAVAKGVHLSRAARPSIARLAAGSGMTALLGIMDRDSVLYLDACEAPAGVGLDADTGRRKPLHATATGKVLLAFAGEDLVQRVSAGPLARLTRATVVDPVTLARHLDDVRTHGYSFCSQEAEPGFASLAIPLRDYTSRVVGALAVAAPSSVLTQRAVRPALVLLRDAGLEIERRIGGVRLGAPGARTAPSRRRG
jgi:DNA-binding IclR family transcriptional regulator